MSWESVIGLELHAQLKTQSKLFSGAATAYGAEPNTQACAIDLGMPGVLPVLNAEVVRMAALFGLATHSSISTRCVFARKNYFYPDLPKGYQISQYEMPIVHGGWLEIEDDHGSNKRIGITRAHLEEDAGKSVHDTYQGMSGIDLNRAGTPLIEIVSEPDLRSAKEAVAYMRKIHAIVRYLGICDGNMQEGSFRCDANVSIRKFGDENLGTRTEIKNLNSFRFVERAINYEIERQIELLENGGAVVQETRLYDSSKDQTRTMRTKEEANDYRYFPDPDLLPVEISADYIESLRTSLPELPDQKMERFVSSYQLRFEDAAVLTESPELANYFETALQVSQAPPKLVANWVLVNLLGGLNKADLQIAQSPIPPHALGRLVLRVSDGTISGNVAKQIFETLWESENPNLDPDSIIDSKGLKQTNDDGEIARLVEQIIAQSPNQVAQYRSGKEKVFGYFVGQIMKATGGKANPTRVNELLRAKLGGSSS